MPAPPPLAGTLSAEVAFSAAANTFYRATLRATDNAALTSEKSIVILVLAAPIL